MKRRDFLLGASAVAASAAVAPVALAKSALASTPPATEFSLPAVNFKNVVSCWWECTSRWFTDSDGGPISETQFKFDDGSSCAVSGGVAFDQWVQYITKCRISDTFFITPEDSIIRSGLGVLYAPTRVVDA